jgi:hypothetical protein
MPDKSANWPLMRVDPRATKRVKEILQRADDPTSLTRCVSTLLAAVCDLIESPADTLTLPHVIESLRQRLGHKSLHEADSQALRLVLQRLNQLETRLQNYETARVSESPALYAEPAAPPSRTAKRSRTAPPSKRKS